MLIMAQRTKLVLYLFIFLVIFNLNAVQGSGSGNLSYDFYKKSCPQLEDIVRHGLLLISVDPTSPSALLRLLFHDCQVQGCDASILLDSNDGTSEIKSSKNFGIRKREAINTLKSMVEAECPQQVSCADILVLAARDAVVLALGPFIRVPLGRRDSSAAPSYRLADASLPLADTGIDETLHLLAEKGMSVEESVAIMGSHTLGVTHCSSILSRPDGGDQDMMDPGFKAWLRLQCPFGSSTPDSIFIVNDLTPFIFDNLYYTTALKGWGRLKIDAQISTDPRTTSFVQHFASDQAAFFKAFSSAFVKLSSFGVLTGEEGMIRKNCNSIIN